MAPATGYGKSTTIILEVGSRVVSAGFAGDSSPSSVHYTRSSHAAQGTSPCLPPRFALANHSLTEKERLGLYDSILKDQHSLAGLASIYGADSHCWIHTDTDAPLTIDDSERLLALFYEIFIVDLQAPPQECTVIVIASQWSLANQSCVLGILLNRVYVKLACLVSSAIMLTILSCSMNALVVDVGWESLRIHPVYDLRNTSPSPVCFDGCEKFNGLSLHYAVIEQLLDFDIDVSLFQDLFGTVQSLVKNAMYVPSLESPHETDHDFEIETGINVPSSIKWKPIVDTFFGDNISLFKAIGDIISAHPIDIRRALWSNIVLVGGVSQIPGFKSRFIQHLKQTSVGVLLPIRAITSLGPWVGGSIYGENTLALQSTAEWKRHDFNKTLFNSLKYRDGTVAFLSVPSTF